MLGEKILNLRKKKGLSQEQLCEKIVDFNQIDKSIHNIEDYFKSNNGSCE